MTRAAATLAGNERKETHIPKSENVHIREEHTRCPAGNYID